MSVPVESANNMDDEFLSFLYEMDNKTLLELLASPLPGISAKQELDISFQLVDGLSKGHDGFTPLEAAPHCIEQQSNLLCSADAFNQGQELTVHPQSGGYGGLAPQEAAPHSLEQPSPFMAAPSLNGGPAAPIIDQGAPNVMEAGPLNSEAYSQYYNAPLMQHQQGFTQNLQPVGVVNGNMVQQILRYPSAAPPQPYYNVPVMHLPEGLQPVSFINGQPYYNLNSSVVSAPLTFAALQLSTSNPRSFQSLGARTENAFSPFVISRAAGTANKKRKYKERQQDDGSYIKKPKNAYILFMQEQLPKFSSELKFSGTAGVNKILGEMWKSLSKEEQDKYYQWAHQERRLHDQQHPFWSSKNNYGKKRRRERRSDAAAVSTSGVVSQPDKQLCVTPTSAGVMETPHLTQHPPPQTPVTGNVPNISPLCEEASTVVDSPMETQIELYTEEISTEMLELLETFEALPPAP